MKDKFAMLATRPDIETAAAKYEKMLSALREQLAAELGPMEWKHFSRPGRSGCAGFSEIKGTESRGLQPWFVDSPISDDKWNQAVRIATEVTKPYGFEEPKAIVNRPGDHKIIAFDPHGASYQLGTAVNTTLTLSTGCHLEAKAHPANAGKTTS